MAARRYFTVSKVTGRIQEILEPATSKPPFWVKAELSSVSLRRGTLYCDLVETKETKVVAKIRCVAWKSDLLRMQRSCEAAGVALEEGTEVGLLCSLTFHPVYGLSLQAHDVDPDVALGALERNKREILARLQSEGLLERNARHAAPMLPTRIGLVASRGTAGFRDFVETLESSGYGFRILHADAQVQGAQAEGTLLAALDRLEALRLDVVVIIRGGGSRHDLSFLDNEVVARRVASFSAPVWTGIGHETDTSVLDAVAGSSFKTPTAVAEELVGRFEQTSSFLDAARRRLRSGAGLATGPAVERLRTAPRRLVRGARTRVERERSRLGADAAALRRTVRASLAEARSVVDRGRRTVSAMALATVRVADQMLAERRKSLAKTTTRALARGDERHLLYRGRLRSPALLHRLAYHRSAFEARVSALAHVVRCALAEQRGLLERQRPLLAPERALRRIERERERLSLRREQVMSRDPETMLGRGYALVFGEEGALLRSAEEASPGMRIRARLHDGEILSTVESTERRR